jgi:hypothetical protein
MIYTVFGALTGMHGRAESHQLRLRHWTPAAAVLLAGASVDTFLSHHATTIPPPLRLESDAPPSTTS